MNTKDNRRARQTVETIIRAFYQVLMDKGSVTKVTVREICQVAGINRSSFYLHFKDPYDLLEQVENHMAESLTESFLAAMETARDIHQCFESMFAFIGEYWQFYSIYLNETNRSGVIGLARELYADRIPASFWKEMGYSSPDELAYHEEYTLAGLTAMIRRWLNTGRRETPRELCDIFLRHYPTRQQYGSLFDW